MGRARRGGVAGGPYDLADDPDLRCRLFLVSESVPFDVAFCLDDATLKAWVVIFGEKNGGVFDWDENEWVRQDG